MAFDDRPRRRSTRATADQDRSRGRAKRGAPPAAELDAADFNQAILELAAAKDDTIAALSPELATLPSWRRREVLDAALAKAALAGRFIDEILERHRYGMRPAKPAPKPVTRAAVAKPRVHLPPGIAAANSKSAPQVVAAPQRDQLDLFGNTVK